MGDNGNLCSPRAPEIGLVALDKFRLRREGADAFALAPYSVQNMCDHY